MPIDEVAKLIGWAACIHDIGKLSPAFQRQTVGTSLIADKLGVGTVKFAYDVRHDSLGWALWQGVAQTVWANSSHKPQFPRAANSLVRCATGHHGKPPSLLGQGTRIDVSAYFNPADIDAAVSWSRWATEYFRPVTPKQASVDKASWWIAGVITLADWIGSDTEWFPYRELAVLPEQYLATALVQADLAITKSGVAQDQMRRSYTELFPSYSPTPVQQAVIDLNIASDRYLLVIEETTGGGKTEAALTAAGGSNFYFGLPTMATTNGLWQRVGELDGQQTLIHGKRWMMPASMDRATAWLNDSSRKALMADIGVGTIDQAMIAVMFARYGVLRLAGLAGKTLIIDELHAYDTYMKRILEVLLEMHARAGGSAILLSATLPLGHRNDYAQAWCQGAGISPPELKKSAFPLITFVSANGQTCENDRVSSRYEADNPSGRRVDIEHYNDIDSVINRIVAELQTGKCVTWIRNTVGEAIEGYHALYARGVSVELFHSRFVTGDRARIEADVLARFGKESTADQRKGRVLVATQVIEQSLDLDFDIMVTDLCPVDLLIQRAGRLHRHSRGDRGTAKLLVYAPPLSNDPEPNWVKNWSRGTGFVYQDHSKLWLSLKIIGNGFTMPADARRLVEGVYGEPAYPVPIGLAKSALEYAGREIARSSTGIAASINPALPYQTEGAPTWDDTQAPTRLGERSVEYVLCESGVPVTGDVNTSTVQVRASLFTGAPLAQIDVGKYRIAIDLLNGSARCFRNKSPARLSYSRAVGLVVE